MHKAEKRTPTTHGTSFSLVYGYEGDYGVEEEEIKPGLLYMISKPFLSLHCSKSIRTAWTLAVHHLFFSFLQGVISTVGPLSPFLYTQYCAKVLSPCEEML